VEQRQNRVFSSVRTAGPICEPQTFHVEGRSSDLGVLCQNADGFSNEVARIKVSLEAAYEIDLENTAFLVRAQCGGTGIWKLLSNNQAKKHNISSGSELRGKKFIQGLSKGGIANATVSNFTSVCFSHILEFVWKSEC